MRGSLTGLALLWLLGACALAAGQAGAWRSAAEPPLGTTGGTATVLSDGRVLLAGGFYRSGQPSPAAQLYEPAVDRWTELPPMPGPRDSQTATLLRDGRVLIAGGSDGDQSLSSALIFDPIRRAWTPTAPMPTAVEGASSLLLDDGRVLVAGGFRPQPFSQQRVALRTAAVYDPARADWSPLANLPAPVGGGRLLSLGEGTVLYAGGAGENGPVTESWLFDAGRDAWTSAGDLPLPMSVSAAAPMQGRRAVVVGSALGPSDRTVAALYSASTHSWSALSSPPGAGTFPLALVPVSRARLLLIEVEAQAVRLTLGGALYDAEKDSWTSIAAYEESGDPGNLDAVSLARGRVLVVGEAAHVFDPSATPQVPRSTTAFLASPSVTLAEGAAACLLLLVLGVRALRSRL